jgi:hypothetical protein
MNPATVLTPETILLLAGIIFILIAIVGGGFEIGGIKIPTVAKWARIVSGFLGVVFCGLFIIITINSNNDSDGEKIIYQDRVPDVSIHGFKLIEVVAKCVHNPPRINDRITVEFRLQNVSNNPIKVLETFVVGRDPDGNNKDFAHSNEEKIIQPSERIETKDSIIVNVPGEWRFGPSYHLENDIYPGEWRRFSVSVVQ